MTPAKIGIFSKRLLATTHPSRNFIAHNNSFISAWIPKDMPKSRFTASATMSKRALRILTCSRPAPLRWENFGSTIGFARFTAVPFRLV
jgi:hypothetical protein